MSENVVALPGANPSGTVNEDLVKLLEGLVDRAKSGEIVGLAYAASNGDELSYNGWESGGHTLLLSSSIATLNARYQLMLTQQD